MSAGAIRAVPYSKIGLSFGVLVLSIAVSACRPSAPAAGGGAHEEGRHAITGQIVRRDAERKTLLVDHDEIPGYMPRMVMEFKVGAGDFANAREGRRIRAEMIAEEAGGFRLEKIWLLDERAEAVVADAAGALRRDTVARARTVFREVGENLPDFALYDQNADVVSAERFRGKWIMLNFIFTRCPVLTMCPAATQRMASLQDQAKEAGITNLELISITLDPEYDTPGVLREYAEARGIDTGNFSFLTGPEGAIKDLLRQFGVHTYFEGNLLQHTLATLLIDERGEIVHRVDGSEWETKAFLEKMRR